MFTSWTSALSRQLFTADPSLASSNAVEKYLNSRSTSKHPISVPDSLRGYDPDRLAASEDTMGKYEFAFNKHLKILLDALDYYAATETVALGRLCAQLSTASERGDEAGLRGGIA